jgi:thiamine transporter ThiT
MASEVYGGGPNRGLAMQKVNGPAIGLMVTSGLAGLWSLVSVVLNLLGASFNMANMGGSSESSNAIAQMTSGVVGVVVALLSLAIAGAIFFGAMKMRALQSYPFAITAAALACLPCAFPCCCFSLPIGVWALVVLFDANVKASFV